VSYAAFAQEEETELPEHLEFFFDWEAYGEHLATDWSVAKVNGSLYFFDSSM